MLKKILNKKKSKKDPLKGYATRGSTVLLVQGEQQILTKILSIEEDRIVYETSNKPIEYHAPVTIRNYGDGVPWQFDVPEISRFSEGKDVYWKSALPVSAKSMERRDNYRVLLPSSDPSRIRLMLENDPIHARIVDLSVTGAKLELEPGVEALLGDTVVLQDAMLLISDLAISCELKIQWLREADEKIYLGVHFVDMDTQDQAQVRKFIAVTEREILKSRPDK